MLALTFLALALPLAGVSATPLARDMVVHEKRDAVPTGFVKLGAAPAAQTLTLRLGLVQSDPAGLEERLMAVSTPSSAEYGQFLTQNQVSSFITPKQDTLDQVNAFLSANGIRATPISPAGDVLSMDVTVAQANALFAAEFDTFKHTATGKEAVRTLAYSIPASLKGHLDFVHPTITFPQNLQRQPLASIPLPKGVTPLRSTANLSSNAVPTSCESVVTPACVQAMYGIPTTPATQSSSGLGVSGFIDQFANQRDLEIFLLNFRPDMPDTTTFALQTLDGGENPQEADETGIEANLDTQYTVGIATGVPVTFISVGDDQEDDVFGFMDIINFLLAEANPPHVLTTSYGSNENEISASVANNLCNAYMQLGARGTSILFSSGDGGVSGSQSGSCTTFVPTFPSGCPFMTSVGATNPTQPETASDFSSGGFSNTFAQPSYQAAAVSSYLSRLGTTNSGKFNAAGRAFPDIAAVGNDVEIVVEDEGGLVAGTSCSSPIFASVIALLNDELVAAGKSPLGFLNPFLYSTGAAALNDITSGSNPGCGTNGFPAMTGWDPITGLGTPNFAALRTAVGL
ncbi:family S53 protease-like protein [Amylostereum chailletii]|nr:family S53 protease-like protein [Amylostereum chailletii]